MWMSHQPNSEWDPAGTLHHFSVSNDAVFRWAAAPAATAFYHMQDAAHPAPVVDTHLAANIKRQRRLNFRPLLFQ